MWDCIILHIIQYILCESQAGGTWCERGVWQCRLWSIWLCCEEPPVRMVKDGRRGDDRIAGPATGSGWSLPPSWGRVHWIPLGPVRVFPTGCRVRIYLGPFWPRSQKKIVYCLKKTLCISCKKNYIFCKKINILVAKTCILGKRCILRIKKQTRFFWGSLQTNKKGFFCSEQKKWKMTTKKNMCKRQQKGKRKNPEMETFNDGWKTSGTLCKTRGDKNSTFPRLPEKKYLKPSVKPPVLEKLSLTHRAKSPCSRDYWSRMSRETPEKTPQIGSRGQGRDVK